MSKQTNPACLANKQKAWASRKNAKATPPVEVPVEEVVKPATFRRKVRSDVS